MVKARKFGAVDPETGKKWGGSPRTHFRYLEKCLKQGDVDIPCGDCSACCRSGVPVYDDDGSELPKNAQGHCAFLKEEGGCSRHDNRPEHCRLFTCTLFSLAGVVTDSEEMNEALQQWEWDLSSKADRDFVAELKQREEEKTIAENLQGMV